MGPSPQAHGWVSFGSFEFDLRACELRKHGLKIKLQGQPVQVLRKLLERPGEIVTRTELRELLWPAGTFVDFEHSLNAAVKRLRRALCDPADQPRYIETVARLGYRFIGLPGTDQAKGHAIDSLAVLPFDNSGADPETDYLSDGITETIISNLSRLAEVRVMARSTVFRYKRKKLDPRSIGRKLNVQAVLAGSVRQRGGDLVIGTELVEVRNGWQLWGEQYNRKLADILSIEEEISREIVENLRLNLNGEDRVRLARHSTRSSEAYQDYLKGRYYWNRMSEDGLEKAIGCFKQAIEKDPDYALAYVGLADTYGLFGFFGLAPPRMVMPKAKEAALRALAIDDSLGEAHASLASVKKVFDWDWPGAEAGYKKSLELNPNYETARRWYADYLSAVGRFDEALDEMRRARELDPLSVIISMETAWNYYMARQYHHVVEQALKTLAMEPQFAPAKYVLGLGYEQLGRYEEAIEAFQAASEVSHDNPASIAALGHAFALAGRAEEAHAMLGRLDEVSGRMHVSPYWRAILHAALGEEPQAWECLELAYRERDVWLVWLKTEPRLDPLRHQPQFADLLRRVGLAM